MFTGGHEVAKAIVGIRIFAAVHMADVLLVSKRMFAAVEMADLLPESSVGHALGIYL